MKPLDQRRSIDAHKLNHTAKVIKKFVPQGSILEQLMNFADSVPDFLHHIFRMERTAQKEGRQEKRLCRTDETYLEELYPADTVFSPKMKKIDFKKKITA